MLLHIGYHKTGTTWLQRFVFSEPHLGFVQPWDSSAAVRSIALVAPFRFDAEDVRRSLALREAGPETWSGRVPVLSHERFSGIPYTGGHDSEAVLDRLHALFPDARVLITVREQCEVVWSAYRQYVLDGGAESLRQWLSPPKTGFGMATRFDPDFYLYHRLVAAYRARFGEGHVLVLPYELLAADRLEFVDRIVAFAGALPDDSGRAVVRAVPATNVSMSRHGTTVKRLANRTFLRTWLSPAAPLDIEGLNYGIGRLIYRADRRLGARNRTSSAPDAARDRLGRRYASSNRALAGMTGLDLEGYGYQW